MPLLKPLARLAFAIAALYGIFFVLGKIGNPYIDDVPDQGALRSAINPAPAAPAAKPPPGFPSMPFPPPKIEVAKGESQPVATRYGTKYDLPADWLNDFGAVAGWEAKDRTIAFNSIGTFGAGYCPEGEGSRLALSGAAGRNGVDIGTAAFDAVRDAEAIFTDDAGRKPTVDYRGPIDMNLSGTPAVRYTAIVTNISKGDPCDPPAAQFDIVAIAGKSTAQVMILMVETDQGLPGSVKPAVVDRIVSSLRHS